MRTVSTDDSKAWAAGQVRPPEYRKLAPSGLCGLPRFVGIDRFDEAEPFLIESLRQGVKFYQDRDPVADHANACLARIAASRKDWDGQLNFARESMTAAHRVFPKGHRYGREGSSALARVLLEQTERDLDEAWKTQDLTAAAKALALQGSVQAAKKRELAGV